MNVERYWESGDDGLGSLMSTIVDQDLAKFELVKRVYRSSSGPTSTNDKTNIRGGPFTDESRKYSALDTDPVRIVAVQLYLTDCLGDRNDCVDCTSNASCMRECIEQRNDR